jgi:transcriptional regulator with XRE-family HTH domain
MSLSSTSPEARRLEFGAFLRSRRQRLSPASVGLREGFRRRTPGLRREEVAQLAGVGATWYTWLEQGRAVRPSAEVLWALAEALRLDPDERRHLYLLDGRTPPEPLRSGPERVEPALRRMLDNLRDQAAYVLGRRWDVLAWNRAAEVLFGDYGQLQGDQRNIMHMVFANAAHRRLLVDWKEIAPVALAMFRADSARHLGDPDFERLIATLSQASAEFRLWWPRHEVRQLLSNPKRIDHPRGGRMAFEYSSFAVDDQTGMKLVVYTPLADERTAEKLERLLRPR